MTRCPSKSVVVTSPALSMAADQSLDAAQISASLILAKASEEESLNSRNHLRTWPIPDLLYPRDGGVPSDLHRQSPLVSNICKEQSQIYPNQLQPLVAELAVVPIYPSIIPRLPRKKTLRVPRYRISMRLSRKPSPIQRKTRSPSHYDRRHHHGPVEQGELANDNCKLNTQSTVIDAGVPAIPSDMALVNIGWYKSISFRPAPMSPLSDTQHCLRVCLPSRSITVCKTCQKQNPPIQQANYMRQQLLTSRPRSTRPVTSPTPRTSFNCDGISLFQCPPTPTYYLDSNLVDHSEVMMHFPGLRRRGLTAKTSQSYSPHDLIGHGKDKVAT